MVSPTVAPVLLFAGQWVWLAAILVLSLLLFYPAMILHKYVRIVINMLDSYSPVVENGGNGSADLTGEEVSFRAADGHRLEGVIISGDPAGPSRGMVVFAHEFGSDRSSCKHYSRPLLRVGYDIFSFDFRGHGGSPPEEGYRPRQWPSDRERADMLGAIAFIGSYLEERGRAQHVGLFGPSRGAGAAILASVGIRSVRAIVTDGAFSSDVTLEYLMKRFATIFARIRVVAENHPPMFWRLLRWLLLRACRRRFNCHFPSVRKAIVRLGKKPILFIHGEKDSYIPVAQSQMLYKLSRGPKTIWIVPGAKHNQSIIVEPEGYARRVVQFFDEYLSSSGKPPESLPIHVRRRASRRDLPTPPYAGAGVTTPAEHAPTA